MKVLQKADKRGRGETVREFDSWQEWMDYCDSPLAPESGNDERTSQEERRASWFGSETYAQADTLARNGWTEGRERVAEFTAKLENVSSQMTLRPSIEYAISGDFVDIGRFVTGEPECFGVHAEEEAPLAGKVVRMLYNGAISGSVSADDAIRRGAATIALIDALENTGRRVELLYSFSSGNSSTTFLEYLVPLKSAGEPVEIDRLAFALAHPSSVRRLAFSAMEHERAEVREKNNVNNSAPKDARYASADIEIKAMEGTDSAALLKWVMEELAKQGVTVEAP